MTKVNFPILTFNEAGIQIIDGDRGFAYPKSSDFMKSGYCLFLSAQNVTADGFKFNEAQFVNEEKHGELRKGTLQRQDIVLTSRGTVGNVALYDDCVPYDVLRINSGMLILRNSGKSFGTDYLHALLRSPLFKKQIRRLSFGSAQSQITVQITNGFEFPCPSMPEQKKIAEILLSWDQAIEMLGALIHIKIRLKKGLMQKMLTGKIRFKQFNQKWKTAEIGDLLDYEQPVKYLVDMVLDYDENSVPVLTANKSFILGSTSDKNGIYTNLPAVIFDDFTTDSKYVDFPFKVKSSAIKILRPKNDQIDLRFVYEAMKIVRFPSGAEHKRYFISEFQYLTIDVPSFEEQAAIGNTAKAIDSEINGLKKKLALIMTQKTGLMQKLLTGKIRVRANDHGK